MWKKRISGKSREDKLRYLNSLEYDIVVKQREGKFYLYIPELSLVSVGRDLNQAYKDLNGKKQEFFDNILECQAEDEVNLPRKLTQAYQLFSQLKIFILKLLIICVLGGSTLIFGGVVIKNQIASISVDDMVKKVARGIVLEAKKFTNIPQENMQMKLDKFREFLTAFRPWIKEFKETLSLSSYGESLDKR